MNKTYRLKRKDISSQWHIIDATNQPLGRLATKISSLILGKHKPTYEPHLAMGDYVVVINSDKVIVTGQKFDQKIYYRHSGYPGGIRQRTFAEQMELDSRRIIEKAVKGMLPHNVRGRTLFKRLKVYSTDKHPHAAQLFASNQKSQDVTNKKTVQSSKIDKNLDDQNVKVEEQFDFDKMTKPQLIQFAEEKEIKIIKSAKKADIIIKIKENL
ncbi:MAG: 50S ribosomal protein L13 [Dehalococcoidaceae bacterium]|nr:50S ribosomal protein L13 [Dehalococcoidaceae bacterium]